MARKPSEAQDNIAVLFEHLVSHLDQNDGVFLDHEMTRPEAKVAQKELAKLAKAYREHANESRINGR